MEGTDKHSTDPRRLPLSPAVIAAVAGFLTMMVIRDVASLSTQMAVLGGIVSAAIGLLVAAHNGIRRQHDVQTRMLATLHTPVDLASEPDLFDLYVELSGALVALSRQPNVVLRRLTLHKLYSVAEEVGAMAAGKVAFSGTETWRAVYEQVLRIPGVTHYRSVACIRTEDYWRDIAGERSMRLNFDLLEQGVRIERLLILSDSLWPSAATFPSDVVRRWMSLQFSHGVELLLVRESNLLSEPELIVDFGIYGVHATGTLQIDTQGRTQRFLLDFDTNSIRMAEERWQKLLVYATSYQELLNPTGE